MQAAFDKNYFEIFGLPESFRLDLTDVTKRYRDLQQQLHPDRYASASDQDRRLSVQMAAQVNEAFQTLKDPVRRGRYLLALKGIDTGEESDTAMNPAFLMEQMELREALETVRDSDNALAELGALETEVIDAFDARIIRLQKCFDSDGNEDLKVARETVRELQFLQKIRAEIEQIEEELV
jgi:molecular chaperone HscB